MVFAILTIAPLISKFPLANTSVTMTILQKCLGTFSSQTSVLSLNLFFKSLYLIWCWNKWFDIIRGTYVRDRLSMIALTSNNIVIGLPLNPEIGLPLNAPLLDIPEPCRIFDGFLAV